MNHSAFQDPEPPNSALDAAAGIAFAAAEVQHSTVDTMLADALRSLRRHLDMDVGFVSKFVDGRRVFRYVSSKSGSAPMRPGDSDPLEESYCQRVVDGRLPELIQDASALPAALELPVTRALPVGAHMSVPIRFSDGSVYGTFCCFSHEADPTLTKRDLGMMRHIADFLGRQIERETETSRALDLKMSRIRNVLDSSSFAPVYQPIVDLVTNRTVGYEALTRFSAKPQRPPDAWFGEAAEVGLQAQLEIAAINKALRALETFPGGIRIGVNISPSTILSEDLVAVLAGVSLERINLEITEHASVRNYAELTRRLEPLRERGLFLAVDDAGAGYASFRHVLRLGADIIKLDRSLIQDIDSDREQRALAIALIRFASEIDAEIVAEGVETEAELQVLSALGVSKAQGYLFGRPAPLGECLLSQSALSPLVAESGKRQRISRN